MELAQRFGAHLVGLHVQRPIDIATLSTGVIPPSALYAAYEAATTAERDTSAATFKRAVNGSHLSTEWRVIKGYHLNELIIQAHYADLLVLDQAEPEATSTPRDLPETVSISSGRATLVVDTKEVGSRHGPAPGVDVSAWLSRHGVDVSVQREAAADADVGDVILSRADHDVDLIVMGLYGHSRLREVILGGASRALLSSMTVPVLVAH